MTDRTPPHISPSESESSVSLRIVAHIHTDFPNKFGIPRQSGLADTPGTVIFLPAYRNPEALRGMEDYSHLWLLWHFSEAQREGWSPTVRPPRLGGNRRMGVFATRSPFRPSAIGLSSVRLTGISWNTPQGPLLHILGADLMDGTPILDIKPYLAFTDSHPEAKGGFADLVREDKLIVEVREDQLALLPPDRREALLQILRGDPRPSYQKDPARIYGFSFAGKEIRFRVAQEVLTVLDISPAHFPDSDG